MRDNIESALRAELQATVRDFLVYLGDDTLWKLAVAYAQRGNAGVVDEWAHAYDAAMEAYESDLTDGFDPNEEYEHDCRERGRDVRKAMA